MNATSQRRDVMAKVRISSLHVELCLVLGDIIRQELRYPVLKTECWTFESEEVLHKPTGGLDYRFHYGSGHIEVEYDLQDQRYFKHGVPYGRVELRSASIPTPTAMGNEWRISVWLKYQNGEVKDLHFAREYGSDHFERVRCYNSLPPDKIKFR